MLTAASSAATRAKKPPSEGAKPTQPKPVSAPVKAVEAAAPTPTVGVTAAPASTTTSAAFPDIMQMLLVDCWCEDCMEAERSGYGSSSSCCAAATTSHAKCKSSSPPVAAAASAPKPQPQQPPQAQQSRPQKRKAPWNARTSSPVETNAAVEKTAGLKSEESENSAKRFRTMGRGEQPVFVKKDPEEVVSNIEHHHRRNMGAGNAAEHLSSAVANVGLPALRSHISVDITAAADHLLRVPDLGDMGAGPPGMLHVNSTGNCVPNERLRRHLNECNDNDVGDEDDPAAYESINLRALSPMHGDGPQVESGFFHPLGEEEASQDHVLMVAANMGPMGPGVGTENLDDAMDNYFAFMADDVDDHQHHHDHHQQQHRENSSSDNMITGGWRTGPIETPARIARPRSVTDDEKSGAKSP